ncbi:hypothetical protein RQP46_008535 [Phenoliferia psychrophenolica]
MHLALLPILALAFAVGGARAQSATAGVYVCPTTDTCQAPLCETGGAAYGTSSADFLCYYSELSGTQLCNYPLAVKSDLYCSYDSKGALVSDHNDDCCPSSASTGVRSSRMKARDASPAPPQAGDIARSLRARVHEWRVRDASRRALEDVPAMKRSTEKKVVVA